MNKNDLIAAATSYMQIWNVNGDHLLDKLAATDLVVEYTHFPGPVSGIEHYRATLKTTYGYFPDIAIDVQEVIVADGRAVVSWQYTGTHSKGELFGMAPANKKVAVKGISLLEFDKGLVVKESGIVDNMSLLAQIGAIRLPAS